MLNKALFHEPIVNAGTDGLVLVRDIDFASTSESTFLPFHGRCHVAYFPSHSVVLGLSKLARLTRILAKRLQTQENFTDQLLQVRRTNAVSSRPAQRAQKPPLVPPVNQ